MFPEFAARTEFPRSTHPGTVTFVGTDGLQRAEPAEQLPDWLKFAPTADGTPTPVVLVVRCRTEHGYSLRSFGPDGQLLWVTLMAQPPTPIAEPAGYRKDIAGRRPAPHPAESGWF